MKCFGRNGLEGTKKPNIKSGFPELDKITNGWNNGDLIVIASRPAIGKTAFGVSLLREITVKNRIPTAFFSLEMSSNQAISRFRMALSKVDGAKIMVYDNGIDALKKAVKDGLAEDEQKNAEAKLQKVHDKYIAKIEEMLAEKDKEIMTV